MKIINVRELNETDFSLCDIFAMEQVWREGQEFNSSEMPRPENALLYLADCNAVYTLSDDTSFIAHKNSIVFIPKLSKYKTEFINTSGSTQSLLINFEAELDGESVLLCDRVSVLENDDLRLRELFEKIIDEGKCPKPSLNKMKAILYLIFDELCRKNVEKRMYSSRYENIARGIAYLENNPEQALSVDEIAEMCHVSGNCFRLLFKDYSGMSPNEFRILRKIERAKRLLLTEVYSVGEISEQLNFSESSYFCRIFKQKTGMTPSEYILLQKEKLNK